MALGFAGLILGGALDLAGQPNTIPVAPSVIRDYYRTLPPASETASVRWVRFQLRAVGANAMPTHGYSLDGQFEMAEIGIGDDWLSATGPR